MTDESSLRIAFLTYRGNPYSGGQGVYTRHLTRALVDLGHSVEVLSGQPYPHLDPRVPLIELPSLDFYNEQHPWRLPHPRQMRGIGDWVELAQFFTLAFPEPLAFSVRAARHLRGRVGAFDLIHDNQCLGYGMLALERMGYPLIATVHHPITVDLRLELERATTLRRRLLFRRWFAFLKMQCRVAARMPRIITDSESSAEGIHTEMGVARERLHVVPVGVDPEAFRRLPNIARRPGRVISTASSDLAVKGLAFLLKAIQRVRETRPGVELIVIGKPKADGPTPNLLRRLNLDGVVQFVTGVSEERLVELYNEAEVAVVPSLYEGFSLPAVEAMSCETALVATTGGALPEVVGRHRETVLLAPPGDADALAARIEEALGDAALRARLGTKGREWVLGRWTWKHSAHATVQQYRALLAERRGSTAPGAALQPISDAALRP